MKEMIIRCHMHRALTPPPFPPWTFRVDAHRCISLAPPGYAKGHYRLGSCFEALKRKADAHSAYSKGLKIDPKNKDLQKGVERTK